jgi:hypothetical protein
LFGRPYSPRQLVVTSPVCSCCRGGCGVAADYCGCCWRPSEAYRAERSRAVCSVTPIPQLIVLTPFPYAQIVRICPSTVVSCSGIRLLSWLCCHRRPSEEWPRFQLATAHPLTTTHLFALAHFPHAQIVRVCPVSEVSCSGMPLLLWLLWFVATFEEEGGELTAPVASGLRITTPNRPPAHYHAPSRSSTFPVCSNHSNMPWE